MVNRLAFAVADSGNAKIRGVRSPRAVATTYASIRATCPTDCELRTSGDCYAMGGHVGLQVRRLDAAGDGRSHLRAAREEAAAIAALPPDRDLRLHTSGDARTPAAAGILARAVAVWQQAGGSGAAWTYTHAWRSVPRKAWGPVSVLASLDRPELAREALRRGRRGDRRLHGRRPCRPLPVARGLIGGHRPSPTAA